MRPNPNPLPVAQPGSPAVDPLPPRRITYTLAWPDGEQVVVFLESHWSSESVPFHWSGSLTRLDAPPVHGDDSMLNNYLERLAESTDGKLTTECRGGEWLLKD